VVATTATLWHLIILHCDGCQEDLARIVAREDHYEAFKATIGQIIIDHGRRYGHDHWGTGRDVREGLTWDELQIALATDNNR
jgi:hypothetical protein